MPHKYNNIVSLLRAHATFHVRKLLSRKNISKRYIPGFMETFKQDTSFSVSPIFPRTVEQANNKLGKPTYKLN